MRSLALILIAASLVLSAPNLSGQESPSPKPAKDSASNPPAPRSGKESQPKQNQPKPAKQPTTQDNRGTEAAPFVIKILDAPKAEAKAEQNKKEANDKPSAYGWFQGLRAEAWAAIFAGVMVIITFSQLGMFFWQLRLTRNATNNAAQAALATVRNFNLSREDHIATHRPKLFVRRLSIREVESGELEIGYFVVNAGPLAARIIRTGGRLWLPFQWPLGAPEIEDIQERDNIQLESGQERRLTYTVTNEDLTAEYGFRTSPVRVLDRSTDRTRIIFMGYVIYLDPLNREHRTGFLRPYDPDTFRFSVSNDPDHEYQD